MPLIPEVEAADTEFEANLDYRVKLLSWNFTLVMSKKVDTGS